MKSECNNMHGERIKNEGLSRHLSVILSASKFVSHPYGLPIEYEGYNLKLFLISVSSKEAYNFQ